MKKILVLILLALAAPAAAQTITIGATIADLHLGPSVLIWPARLANGTRFGYLAYTPMLDRWSVVTWHSSRSGWGGTVPAPGLCVEALFAWPAGAWTWVPGLPVDGDGDGDDDLVLQEMAAPQRFVTINLDLVLCR